MRLVVKKDGHAVNELMFAKGPIYIGRHTHSQVLLSDSAVSRQHAVIFFTQEENWVVEDLDSANKTYLNDKPIHKAEIKTGDIVRISDFIIEIDLNEQSDAEEKTDLADTLTTAMRGPQIIARELDSPQAPPIRMPAKRTADFLKATKAIAQAGTLDEVLISLLDIMAEQFDAFHAWVALRSQPSGPMTSHAGKKRDGSALRLDKIKLSKNINQAVEKNEFLLFLFSRDPNQPKKGDLRSAVIAPVMGGDGCFGLFYVDNAIDDEHYSLSDLDYLMLLGIHTAARLETL